MNLFLILAHDDATNHDTLRHFSRKNFLILVFFLLFCSHYSNMLNYMITQSGLPHRHGKNKEDLLADTCKKI